MIKKLVIALSICIFLIGISACSKNNSSTEKNDNTVDKKDINTVDKTNSEDFKPIPEFDKNGIIEEKTIYDKNNIKIIAKELTYNDYQAELTFEFINNTKTNLKFNSQSLSYSFNSVNEFMSLGGFINTEVKAGKKVSEVTSFDYENLSAYGIDQIADLVFDFQISPTDFQDNFKDIQTGPLKIETTLANSYDYKNESRYRDRIHSKALMLKINSKVEQFNDKPIYSSNKIEIQSDAILSMGEADEKKEILLLELYNGSADQIIFQIADMKVNNNIINEGIWSRNAIDSNKKKIEDIDISYLKENEEYKKANIENIENISFTIRVFNKGENDIVEPKEVTIKVKK